MKSIAVLIVDDSLFIRRLFSQMLSSEPDIHVVGTASDAIDAREKIKQLNPDVLTLDIEMPKMDGLCFLEKIMTLRPMPVIMVSSLTQNGSEETLRALELGAFDFINKSVSNHTGDTVELLKHELITKVRAAANANINLRNVTQAISNESPIVPFHPMGGQSGHIIAIGSSTGGVEALREILIRLPANSPPIVITQHMPASFTSSFAARLNKLCEITVSEAKNHDRLKVGHAYIAPGGAQHLKIVNLGDELICKLEGGPLVSGHRPSVDALFYSVAKSIGERAIGVILTGMGHDGAEGMKAMRDHGAYNIGQNKSSCVVYGMPQAAFKAGATHIELPLKDIPAKMLKISERRDHGAR